MIKFQLNNPLLPLCLTFTLKTHLLKPAGIYQKSKHGHSQCSGSLKVYFFSFITLHNLWIFFGSTLIYSWLQIFPALGLFSISNLSCKSYHKNHVSSLFLNHPFSAFYLPHPLIRLIQPGFRVLIRLSVFHVPSSSGNYSRKPRAPCQWRQWG